MEYKFADISISPYSEEASDCLAAMLGEIGFDTFEPSETGVKAYIQSELFDEAQLKAVIADFFLPVSITYSMHELENKDYNEQWERENFDPVLEREFGIRLNPRMAFGSGSHDTTHQLVTLLMSMDFEGQKVLDMGCGTGVLGIAMAKRGAAKVTAIDIDDMSVENTKLNFSLNFPSVILSYDNTVSQTSGLPAAPELAAITGDASSIEGTFHTIVANIFKSILLRDMPVYIEHLAFGGTLVLSGFYSADAADLIDAAMAQGLMLQGQSSQNDWTVLIFRK